MKKSRGLLIFLATLLILCSIAFAEAAPATVVGEFNGEALTFADFSNVGTSQWQENEGVISVVDHSQHAYLRLDKLLGNDYTIDFDFKKEDAGFNNVFIGFGIKDGHANLTESGYSLNLVAGFARVMRYENYDVLFGNHFDGDVNMASFLDWTHIQIACKDGKDYTITFNDGAERKIEFTDETFPGGYFVLSAYGSTPCWYKNIKVTAETEEEVTSNEVVGTYNGEPLNLSEFSNCAFGSWSYADGVVTAEELSDFTLLRLEKNLGSTYTIEYDVKQEDTTSGWQTIMAGFDCKEGKNLTESGYVLDMHNAGVARVIVYGKANAGAAHAGSYENPFGGNAAYAAPTDWIHVKIERMKNDFTVTINDGEEKVLTFTDDTQNGGYLCLGAVGQRKISYKDIVITSTEEITIEEEKPRVRAVTLEKNPGLGNTFNGETITFEDWVQLDEEFAWDEQNGIMSPVQLGDWASIGFNKALGDTYTIELDVKQYDISTGWNTVMIGFDVNEGESFFTSGLTLDLHNAGVWRVIDWKNANNNDVPMGNYNNPFGGTLPYSCTTQWQHVKITREGSFYTVTLDDGNPQMSTFETDQFNGGHLVIAAVGTRDVMFKNIHIKDYVEVDLGEVIYPEEIGTTTYTFNGNQYSEWLTTNAAAWTASGKGFTQTLTEGEQTAYLDTEPVRNFRLEMDYEVMSEDDGTFGVGFRKKNGAGSYKNLGYSLIFNMADQKNRLTFADYAASSAAGIDGKVHGFELAGHLVLECSGNQVHIWLDDELIVNAKDNSYAYGLLSLYTENCSVAFSNIKVTSDYLTTDSCKQVIKDAADETTVTEEVIAEYDALSAFQKSFVAAEALDTLEAVRTKLANAWIPYAVGGGALAIIVIAAVIVLLKKGKKAKKA